MIGIISDIHGNYPALQAVLRALDLQNIVRIYCLGDVAGYYCQINECCALLRKREIPTLMGNHDWYLTSGNYCPRSRSANDCLDYQRKNIDREHLDWLSKATLRMQIDDAIDCVHGGWDDPLDEYVIPSEGYFGRFPFSLFLSGHTHVQGIWKGSGKTYCNPGSVGQPRDGDPHAAFATWDGANFNLHRVAYDIDDVAEAMTAAGFPAYYHENLRNGLRIGGTLSKSPFTAAIS
ncbi:metallophosphoesterase family protein [Dongia soli]|uniref:Metallophosphoesterase family protein n=1 Tax=Dongia soli TaxID=600628 RepID=A0ABU5ECI0_9PROT|nr:metallophosphoesterase family protein [Dongia soli]MDY0884071.1 metallophosphoesterase family protein [Dongia soli]